MIVNISGLLSIFLDEKFAEFINYALRFGGELVNPNLHPISISVGGGKTDAMGEEKLFEFGGHGLESWGLHSGTSPFRFGQ